MVDAVPFQSVALLRSVGFLACVVKCFRNWNPSLICVLLLFIQSTGELGGSYFCRF